LRSTIITLAEEENIHSYYEDIYIVYVTQE